MLERIPEVAKALIAFFAPGAAMIVVAVTETSAGGTAVTAGEWIGAVATAVVVGGTVYAVPNRTAQGAVIAAQDARAPEIVHPAGRLDSGGGIQSIDGVLHYNGQPADLNGYAQGSYNGSSKVGATYHDADGTRQEVKPGDVGFATYGDEQLPPESGQSASSTAPSETGSESTTDVEKWDRYRTLRAAGISESLARERLWPVNPQMHEVDETPVDSSYIPKHERE